MKVQSVASLYLVIAVLLVMAVVTEVFVDDVARPRTVFGYLLISTLVSGIVTTVVLEKLDAHVLV